MPGRKPLYPPKGWAQPLNKMITAICDRAEQLAVPETKDGKQFDYELRASLRDVITEVIQQESLTGAQTAYIDRLAAAGLIYNDSKVAKPRWLVAFTELSVDDGVRADHLARSAKASQNKGSRKRLKAVQAGIGAAGAKDKLDGGQTTGADPAIVRTRPPRRDQETEWERILRENRELEEQVRRLRAERDDWKDQAEHDTVPLKEDNARLTTMVRVLLRGGEQAEMLKQAATLVPPPVGAPDWSRG
jgi:hypothetical protein